MLALGNLIVDSLDYVFIVDRNYKIIYNTRYENRLLNYSKEYDASDVINKSYFDVYPDIKREDSSIVKCIETREIIINKHQAYKDYLGRKYVTNNVTFPITRQGELIAVVELSMDSNESSPKYENRKFDDFILKLQKEAGIITFDKIITCNERLIKEIARAKVLAELPTPVLIYGETGTGKELFAQSIIAQGKYPDKKVVVQNCAAVPENLMESIMFGSVKGVFTGAENAEGLFSQADGGILFLDEICSIPYNIQPKLLRVIQEGSFRPLGATKDKHVSVKVIAAMNIEPLEAIEKKILRKDLFYRFSGGLISILPLRERPEDIELYMEYFLKYYCNLYNKNSITLSKEVKDFLRNYCWPGNVRELKNMLESMIVTVCSGDRITMGNIPEYLLSAQNIEKPADFTELTVGVRSSNATDTVRGKKDDFKTVIESTERFLILEALRSTGGNVAKAAQNLNLPRETLRYKIKKYGIY